MSTPIPTDSRPGNTLQNNGEEDIFMQTRKVNIIIESITDPFFVLGKNLEVLLINIAALNGIKYNKENVSYIKITSDEDNEYIYLVFEDNGKRRKRYGIIYD